MTLQPFKISFKTRNNSKSTMVWVQFYPSIEDAKRLAPLTVTESYPTAQVISVERTQDPRNYRA